ncbi:GntR family transcriptional regulator [Pelagovum pacificum]|uniref:GntR family transcriptional regulator n=1 Tax=Pelagovum pacificum TaxID=2588711 RepID=A0A5C5G9E5_9RHOB|nr:GntR family transcriptional regulator [Pelagovum pacificum]QQA41961.1 GntR family transcriptional regulator [Pelagovum pacificum]TNY30598.1 GntR family transcriptional regulator [Pelagovum pacificum]
MSDSGTKRQTGAAAARKTGNRPARNPSLTETVYQKLRSDILSCRLEPGQEIIEAELAEQFQVSKTPVREALATLRQERLVRTFPRRGYQIAPITFGDMNELFDLRTILEAGAAELACDRITDDELDELRALATTDYDQDAEPTIEAFIAANREFHLGIAHAARNERLMSFLTRQMSELERFFYLGAQLRDVNSETNTEHLEIVEALARRDRQAAHELMVRHNNATRQGLFQSLATSHQMGKIGI